MSANELAVCSADEKLTFWTPSYRNDAERFSLLRNSIRYFYEDSCQHIVLVPKKDVALFKQLNKGDADLVIREQEEFVHPRFYPSFFSKLVKYLAPSQSWRVEKFNGKSGWIQQQIIKLCLPQVVDSGPVLIIDSDTFFVNPLSKKKLGLCEEGRFLLKDCPTTESGRHRNHMERSRKTLGLPAGSTEHHYMTSPQIWYPDFVTSLRKHLEKSYQLDWQLALYKSRNISEYLLYGLYIEEMLKPENLLIKAPLPYYIAWDEQSYTNMIANPRACITNNFSIVVQSNLGHEINEYQHILDTAKSNFK